MLTIMTSDNKQYELNEELVKKCYLLSNISLYPSTGNPVKILVSSSILLEINKFVAEDRHVLKPDYNPLEIHFPSHLLYYFDDYSLEIILEICNAANYLEYPYLLELCCKVIANRLSQGSKSISNTILGDARISDEDMDRMKKEYDWIDDNL